MGQWSDGASENIVDITDSFFNVLEKIIRYKVLQIQVFLAKERIKSIRNDTTFNIIFVKAKSGINFGEVNMHQSQIIKLSDVIKGDEWPSSKVLVYEIIYW